MTAVHLYGKGFQPGDVGVAGSTLSTDPPKYDPPTTFISPTEHDSVCRRAARHPRCDGSGALDVPVRQLVHGRHEPFRPSWHGCSADQAGGSVKQLGNYHMSVLVESSEE